MTAINFNTTWTSLSKVYVSSEREKMLIVKHLQALFGRIGKRIPEKSLRTFLGDLNSTLFYKIVRVFSKIISIKIFIGTTFQIKNPK